MGLYREQVLPRVINVVLAHRELAAIRERVASGLWGEVLEVGFGSGLNVPHYPPRVERVLAVDPATVGRKLAARRVARSPVPVEYLDLEGPGLPLDDASVGHVLVTWTLCTIPDVTGALAEMHRVLRPEGRLHFVEHGRSPDGGVAAWQDRMNPLQRRLAGGCNLNRPIDRLVEGAGFRITGLDRYYMPGPRPLTYTYEGRAAKG